jgi:hypothetical protein
MMVSPLAVPTRLLFPASPMMTPLGVPPGSA